MDMSKLPKFSDTPQPPANQPDEKREEPNSHPMGKDLQMGYGPEIWLSFVIGVLLMLMGRSFASFVIAKITGHPYHTGFNWTEGPMIGQEVSYFDLQGFPALTETGLFLFGLALVLEGFAIMLALSRVGGKLAVVGTALVIATAATAFNLYVVIRLLTNNTIPTFALLAVAFGGYMCLFLWKLLRALRFKSVPKT